MSFGPPSAFQSLTILLTHFFAAILNGLEEKLADKDPAFIVFPHDWSEYDGLGELPSLIETAEDIPDDIDKWLTFPQA